MENYRCPQTMLDPKDACFKLSRNIWPLSFKIFVFHNLKEK